MADLLKSLMQPSPTPMEISSSQESFHSFTNDVAHPLTHATPRSASKEASQSMSHGNENKADDPGEWKLYSADEYLNHIGQEEKNNLSKNTNATVSQPIEYSKSTSHFVPTLYSMCQARGLTPVFELDGEADRARFGGTLKVGEKTFRLDRQYRSKKEAKERLAESAIAETALMQPQTKNTNSDHADVNWVGKLLEYHNAEFGPTQSPEYTVYTIGNSFACVCKISGHPDRVFGADNVPFPGKKAARANAAAEAVNFLIAEGKLNPDGSPLTKKKSKANGSSVGGGGFGGNPGSGVKHDALQPNPQRRGRNRLRVNKAESYTKKVSDLHGLLGLQAPQYRMSAVSENAPSILSGYAIFPDNPFLTGPIGVVQNVFGKKDTKEEIAKGVWERLVELANSRDLEILEECYDED